MWYWYYDTPIGRIVIFKRPYTDAYVIEFNKEQSYNYSTPDKAADDAFCHSTGIFSWDDQIMYDVPDSISEWEYGWLDL